MQKLIKMIPILEKSLLQNGINGISIYTHIVDGYIICDRRKEINLPHAKLLINITRREYIKFKYNTSYIIYILRNILRNKLYLRVRV